MLVYRTFKELRQYLKEKVDNGSKVGFVPTMGALHNGHLSLVQQANFQTDITLVSIFVNPTQFNKSEDLEKYPRTEEGDIKKLESAECDVVFIPSVDEVYPKGYSSPYVDLQEIALVMEGKHRPGHFEGVMQVVGRFFEQIAPDIAFFGEKDYQQLAVIKKMVAERNFPIQIVGCSIHREDSGLAMSSRNERISDCGLRQSTLIVEQMNWARANFEKLSVNEITTSIKSVFELRSEFDLEYVEIADTVTLQEVNDVTETARIFIATHIEGVRLIDNMALN